MREAVIDLTDDQLEELGYGDLITLCREAGVRHVELLEDEGRGGIAQVELGDSLDADRLASLACLDSWELVSETGDTSVYVFEVTALELSEQASEDHDRLVGPCDPTVTDRGLLLSLVGSQEAIREMLRHFEDAGVRPALDRLGEYEGRTETTDALTDRQREVIETAYRLGFYEVPREASTGDVAGELDLDPATVSEHLQRAERNLLATQLTAQ